MVSHGIDLEVVAIVAGGTVAWGVVSSRFERLNVTTPMAFLAFGLLAANLPGSIVIHPGSATVREIAEITLALVLFGDASRVNLRALGADAAVPSRLLLIGLPLAIGFGVLAALVVFPGIDIWIAAVIAAAVAPTDASLGAPIMEDRRIPLRVRRSINVESGLNDGIALPIVTVFIAGAASDLHVAGAHGVFRALASFAAGVGIGAATGFVSEWLLEHAARRGWASRSFQPIAVLGIALFAYTVTIEAGGNGFVAAFVAGLAFGTASHRQNGDALELTVDAGTLGSIVVWFLFGALLVPTLEHAGWEAVLYAILSLTVVRMLPVALALAGTHLDRRTLAVLGWLGPRGLASIVFALLAYDAVNRSEGQVVLATVSVVVLLSVVAHGVSARPLAGWYSRYVDTLHPDRPEHDESAELPTRPLVRLRRPPGRPSR